MNSGNYCNQTIVRIVVAISYKSNLDVINKVIQNMSHNAKIAEHKTFHN